MTRPPRLVARTLAVTFLPVAAILAVVFIVLFVDARDRVRAAEAAKLQLGEQVFASLDATRQREQLSAVATLAESPTLRAAFNTYVSERQGGAVTPDREQALRASVAVEIERLAALTGADVLGVVDVSGRIVATAGPARERWPVDENVGPAPTGASFQTVAVLPGGAFRVSGAPLRLDDRDIGALLVGRSLDASYAQELSVLSSAGVVITVNGEVVGRTLPDAVTRELLATVDSSTNRILNGEEYAIRQLLALGPARIYALTSIDAAARAASRDAVVTLGTIGLGAFVLAACVSLWLARALSDPINRLSNEIEVITAAHDFTRQLAPTGSSRELDALTTAFNHLMQGLSAAEAESRAAYLGAIRALATALDARDPYTAGHSERVSALSVVIGRELKLPAGELDVVRLGALLHDIGKIGLSDAVLRKPGPLTADEFEQIKQHPALGARILRQVPFLASHVPIVELHHERVDGLGYPYGLRADKIPIAARIVHVADAFDAITSARAYRPARSHADALGELRRFAGSQFDPACVGALITALPGTGITPEPALQELLGRQLA